MFLAHFTGWSYRALMDDIPAAELASSFKEAWSLYEDMNRVPATPN